MPRPARATPRALCDAWPNVSSTDPVGEVARRFTNNLAAAIGGRSLRTVGGLTGVDHTAISKILAGESWPDLATIAKLEIGLDTELWPRHII